MSSKRLPGKVLLPLLGKPMLSYTLERVGRAKRSDSIIVATSAEASDDPLYEFCQRYGAQCYRGPLEDVAKRFLNVIDQYNISTFVRICADSPFVDELIIDHAIDIFQSGDYGMVTNTLVRSFPKGQSVEVLNSETFRAAYTQMRGAEDFEHVTRYFHTHQAQFKIHNFTNPENHSEIQLSVDTPEDFQIAEKIIKAMNRPHWEYGWEEILKIYRRFPPSRE